ncbi:TniB family NTP-binding protein [Iodobacter sp. LRB]|uniref:TniB family NTP-binding protein n=1 Tax=unclassified Iodobacter TaxID=235634 RepID=UPI000C0FC7B3|nr:TniB family NTP-binding protein [Iodobacter sp. BJB302]PHU99857.1 hypothetical protein CSQ88_20300 [Iodobacter sp. BJB302]
MDPIQIMAQFAPAEGSETQALLGFRLNTRPILHRRFRSGIFQIADLHQRQLHRTQGSGMSLCGISGVGKSTIIRSYETQFPRVFEQHRTRIPVLFVAVPSAPTVRSLAGAILEAMGDQKSHRGSGPEKTTRIRQFFKRCGVELLLLDEFQHIFYAPTATAFRDLTDWLKNLLEETGVGIVACGLRASEFVIDSNEQLARRFSQRVRIEPFSFEDEADFKEFRGILRELEAGLPIPPATPLHESNLARRFWIGSYGLLDYVIKILEGAISVANLANVGTLDLDVYAAGFRNRVWRDVPDRLNPFHVESPLRPLDRPGELFHLHVRQEIVGSPVANKLGLSPGKGGA